MPLASRGWPSWDTDPRSSLFSGHPFKSHWLPFNLELQGYFHIELAKGAACVSEGSVGRTTRLSSEGLQLP